jgi:hypothetical protein
MENPSTIWRDLLHTKVASICVEDASAMCHDKLDWNVVWQEQDLLLQTQEHLGAEQNPRRIKM